ncbi:hypothetical protein GCM10009430_15620 [Aquimarina litoralis]|uniref:Uncharacterized protein n=1 Tax=Aquimarina litoralis TaxID=584605 RepID=A0ABP3TXM2_9FLAO
MDFFKKYVAKISKLFREYSVNLSDIQRLHNSPFVCKNKNEHDHEIDESKGYSARFE